MQKALASMHVEALHANFYLEAPLLQQVWSLLLLKNTCSLKLPTQVRLVYLKEYSEKPAATL